MQNRYPMKKVYNPIVPLWHSKNEQQHCFRFLNIVF
jgi:hypothetical protein